MFIVCACFIGLCIQSYKYVSMLTIFFYFCFLVVNHEDLDEHK